MRIATNDVPVRMKRSDRILSAHSPGPVTQPIHRRLFYAVCFVVGIAFAGCGEAHVPDIDGPRARELVRNGALLVDVRSSLEFWWSHNEGAVNISYGDLEETIATFDKQRPIIVYSRSGARSANAKRLLSSAGFTAYDLGAKQNW